MKQALALSILANGHSVFLTGPAGSGKTFVLQEFIRFMRSQDKKVAVTASTGLAATHLGGNTIHSWSGIGISDSFNAFMVRDMTKARREQIVSTDILIIDEVSMLHDFRLDIIEKVCRAVRENDKPFGGLQVILCGDFFQLPPINRSDSRSGGFIINAESWSELNPVICYLEEQHRQDDNELLEILTALRENDLRRRHVDALMSRIVDEIPEKSEITELYTHNQNVDHINNRKLAEIDGDVHQYEMDGSGRPAGQESLKKSCLAPELLQLKKGAFVMFVKNSLEKKYVNGTLGVVVDFDKDTGLPMIKTKDGKMVLAKQDTWELRDGDKKIASISQIPLRLAWAITIHKSQGMTLDGAHVDLSNAFVEGMGYVALSRVRSLRTLTLGGLNRTALVVNGEALQIDEELREKSTNDEVVHANLVGVWEKLQKQINPDGKKQSKTSGGPWQERLDKMRQNYPNAYKPWKDIEDLKLLKMFEKDVSVSEMSKKLGRHENSVRLRLHKHLGERLVTHDDFGNFDFERASEKQKNKK